MADDTGDDTARIRVRDLFGEAPDPATHPLTLRDPRPDGKVLRTDADVAEALDLLAAGYPLLNQPQPSKPRIVFPGLGGMPAAETVASAGKALAVWVGIAALILHEWSAALTLVLLLSLALCVPAAAERRRMRRAAAAPTLDVSPAGHTHATYDLSVRAAEAAADVKRALERSGQQWVGSSAADELGHIRRVLVEVASLSSTGEAEDRDAVQPRIGEVLVGVKGRVQTLNDYAAALGVLDASVAGQAALTRMRARDAHARLDAVEADLAQRPPLADDVTVAQEVARDLDEQA